MNNIAQTFEYGEDLEGWIALDTLLDKDDMVDLILEAYSFGVALFKIIDMKPYIPETLKPRIMSGLAIVNEG